MRCTSVFVYALLFLVGCGGGGATPPVPQARLTSLDLEGLVLDPPFDPEVRSYRVDPGLFASTIELAAEAETPDTRILVNGKRAPQQEGVWWIDLDPRETVVGISLVDEAGAVHGSYLVRCDRSFALERSWLKARYPGFEDHFGRAVAASGDTLVISAPLEDGDGSPEDDDHVESAGAVYVFERVTGGWEQRAYLKADSPLAHETFGFSVAISGDAIVVGAPGGEQPGQATGETLESAGAVYVFVRDGATWTRQARLGAAFPVALGRFGRDVSISGDTLVVGVQDDDSDGSSETDESLEQAGAAHVFERSGGTWTRTAYLKSPDIDAWDRYGYSVGVSGDTIVIGAPGEDSDGSATTDESLESSGAAYVYYQVGQSWNLQGYLKADVPGEGDFFGAHVAIDGNTVVVGASLEDSDGSSPWDVSAEKAGAAYVFERHMTAWTQQAWLKAWNPGAGDHFGGSVAISGDSVLVGAALEDSGSSDWFDDGLEQAGAAYLFVREGASWVQGTYLKASVPDAEDRFGHSVALAGDTALVGAYLESSDGSNRYDNSLGESGAAYAFR